MTSLGVLLKSSALNETADDPAFSHRRRVDPAGTIGSCVGGLPLTGALVCWRVHRRSNCCSVSGG